LLALAILAPLTARAEETQTRVDLSLGLFTPIGAVGIELGQQVHDHLEISAGIGLGFSGPQAATMVRLQTGGTFKLTFGIGASVGHLEVDESCYSHECNGISPTSADVAWANAEAGVRTTSTSGYTFRAFVGLGTPIKITDFMRDERADTELEGMMLPYAGIAFGITL